jgi:uncharacterized membrane protein YeiB
MKKFIAPVVAAGSVLLASGAHAAVDLTTAATSITDDLTAAQGKALPIFATMFGIVLVLGFFKRATH